MDRDPLAAKLKCLMAQKRQQQWEKWQQRQQRQSAQHSIASKLREWLRLGCLKRVDRRAEPEAHFVDSGGKTNSHRFLRAR